MIREKIIENGERVLHYSDENKLLRQVETGELYYDAVDVLPCQYTYEETDEIIPEEERIDHEGE